MEKWTPSKVERMQNKLKKREKDDEEWEIVENRRKLIKSRDVFVAKKMALDLSEATRAGKFTRVSGEFLERINTKLEALIRGEVHSHPSVGKTLK
jgi:hypothetical protein